MSLKSLANHFIDWVFFENETMFDTEHQSVLQRITLKYSRVFYQEFASVLIQRIQDFYEKSLINETSFSHKTNHHVMMLISLLPYCDFEKVEVIEVPKWDDLTKRWLLKPYTLRFLNLDKFIFKDPKRALLLTPLEEIDINSRKQPYYLVFMGTHPLPTSPGWQVGLCADSSPFLNFGELILNVFEKEVIEVVDLIIGAKKSPLICTGHSLGGALSLLLYQKRPQIHKVYALNPPRFINSPKVLKPVSSQCVVYVQKGDFLQQVGMKWPQWTEVVELTLIDKKSGIMMAHCRCFSAHQDCGISITQGDPYRSKFSYLYRYITTSLWQILSLPFFIIHSLSLLFRYVFTQSVLLICPRYKNR